MTKSLPDFEVKQCERTAARTGERCKRKCRPGHVVCDKHGAKSPNAEKRAAMRVEEIRDAMTRLANPALEVIEQVMADPNAKPMERLKASDMVFKYTLPSRIEAEVTKHEDEELERGIAQALGMDWDELLRREAAGGADDDDELVEVEVDEATGQVIRIYGEAEAG